MGHRVLAAAGSSPPTLWQQGLGGFGFEGNCLVEAVPGGGWLVFGSSTSGPGGTKSSANIGDADYWIVRLDNAGVVQWDRTYGGNGLELASGLNVDSVGGCLLVGYSGSPASGNKTNENAGAWVVRLGPDGTKRWDRGFGLGNVQTTPGAALTADGGVVVALSKRTNRNPPGVDYELWRLDADGNPIWNHTFVGQPTNVVAKVVALEDGTFVVGGRARNPERLMRYDYWLARHASDGTLLWSRLYGGNGEENLRAIQPLPGGGFLLAGDSSSLPSGIKTALNYGTNDYWVVRVDDDGEVIWDRSYGGSRNDWAYDLRLMPGGGFAVAGGSESPADGTRGLPGYGGMDGWVIRCDSLGEPIWEHASGGANADGVFSFAVAPDGGLLLGADTSSTTNDSKTVPLFGATDLWTIRLGPEIVPPVDHLVVHPPPSPQVAGRPLPVSIAVVDAAGQPIRNFQGVVNVGLSKFEFGAYTTLYFGPVSNFVDGVWSGHLQVTNVGSNVTVSAQIGFGPSGFASRTFDLLPAPRLAVIVPPSAPEGAGPLGPVGLVQLPHPDSVDIVVSLAPSDALDLEVSPTVFIPAGQTSAVFSVTVLDDNRLEGPQVAEVIATSPYYRSGTGGILVADNETAILTLEVPATVTEGAGFQAGAGTLRLSAPPAKALSISLQSSDLSRLSPPSMSIEAGQTNAPFPWVIPDNPYLDGPVAVTVTAAVPGWTAGTATTVILDNESTNIIVHRPALNQPLLEGDGTLTKGFSVQLGGLVRSNVTLEAWSSDSSELTVPISLVVTAGLSRVDLPVTVVDDSLFDGTQSVELTVSAPGFGGAQFAMLVADDDVHHLVIAPSIAEPTSSIPFQVSAACRDINDVPIFKAFNSPLTLAAWEGDRSVRLLPGAISAGVRGVWSGTATFFGWGSNVFLRVTTTNGVSGQSQPFTVRPPTWSETLRLDSIEPFSNSVRLRWGTAANYAYQVEWSEEPRANWRPLDGPAVAPDNGEMSVVDPIGNSAFRFYRLRLVP